MFYLIETPEQLEKFSHYDLSESFIEVILQSDNVHSVLSPVCAYFIRPNRSRTGFILPISHSETFSLQEEDVVNLFSKKVKKMYTSDAKRTLFTLDLDIPVICLKTLKWLETGEVLDDTKYNTVAHNFFYGKYPERSDINRLIPIVKHQEKWNNYIQDNKKLYQSKTLKTKWWKFYNTTVPQVFHDLEYSGLHVNKKALATHYPEATTAATEEGLLYTHYNTHTSTGRPSNTFGGINFGAMNKADDSREFITPRFQKLVEFDYHSYHPNILCKLMEYDFEGDLHTHLGQLYFNKEVLSQEEYDEGKKLTFKLLYTSMPGYDNVPFIKRVREYKDMMWRKYREQGFISAPISGRPLSGIDSPTQILPYILQNYETERNVMILKELQEYLSDKDTKLVLYTYDSFLFDFSKHDGPGLLEDVQAILEQGGFPISVKVGKDYAHLQQLS